METGLQPSFTFPSRQDLANRALGLRAQLALQQLTTVPANATSINLESALEPTTTVPQVNQLDTIDWQAKLPVATPWYVQPGLAEGLTAVAASQAFSNQIEQVVSANNCLKRGNFKAAEHIMGRPLTTEEISNQTVTPQVRESETTGKPYHVGNHAQAMGTQLNPNGSTAEKEWAFKTESRQFLSDMAARFNSTLSEESARAMGIPYPSTLSWKELGRLKTAKGYLGDMDFSWYGRSQDTEARRRGVEYWLNAIREQQTHSSAQKEDARRLREVHEALYRQNQQREGKEREHKAAPDRPDGGDDDVEQPDAFGHPGGGGAAQPPNMDEKYPDEGMGDIDDDNEQHHDIPMAYADTDDEVEAAILAAHPEEAAHVVAGDGRHLFEDEVKGQPQTDVVAYAGSRVRGIKVPQWLQMDVMNPPVPRSLVYGVSGRRNQHSAPVDEGDDEVKDSNAVLTDMQTVASRQFVDDKVNLGERNADEFKEMRRPFLHNLDRRLAHDTRVQKSREQRGVEAEGKAAQLSVSEQAELQLNQPAGVMVRHRAKDSQVSYRRIPIRTAQKRTYAAHYDEKADLWEDDFGKGRRPKPDGPTPSEQRYAANMRYLDQQYPKSRSTGFHPRSKISEVRHHHDPDLLFSEPAERTSGRKRGRAEQESDELPARVRLSRMNPKRAMRLSGTPKRQKRLAGGALVRKARHHHNGDRRSYTKPYKTREDSRWVPDTESYEAQGAVVSGRYMRQTGRDAVPISAQLQVSEQHQGTEVQPRQMRFFPNMSETLRMEPPMPIAQNTSTAVKAPKKSLGLPYVGAELPLGKYKVDTRELFGPNKVLSLRHQTTNRKVAKFKNQRVSPGVHHALSAMLKGGKVVRSKVTDGDRVFLTRLIHASGASCDGLDMPADINLPPEKQMQVVMGEMDAGNDAPELKAELKALLSKLKRMKMLDATHVADITTHYLK